MMDAKYNGAHLPDYTKNAPNIQGFFTAVAECGHCGVVPHYGLPAFCGLV